MNLRNFFAELKRRNIIRAAGLYLVGAWLSLSPRFRFNRKTPAGPTSA